MLLGSRNAHFQAINVKKIPLIFDRFGSTGKKTECFIAKTYLLHWEKFWKCGWKANLIGYSFYWRMQLGYW